MFRYKLNPGHPEDKNLHSLELMEQSIQVQLEFEHQVTERDKREIELAKCFLNGKLILRGKINGFYQTIDPEVSRAFLIQGGRIKGVLYVNQLRKICVAFDWMY